MKQANSFRDKVYELAKRIPPGKVVTYGQLAHLVGSPKAARAVGMCMSQNPDNGIVPCHRVVASDGKLTGFAFGGVSEKKKKLESEGVTFLENKVDLARFQWRPQ